MFVVGWLGAVFGGGFHRGGQGGRFFPGFWLIPLLLLVGFLVRVASLLGLLMVLNFLLAKGSAVVGINAESLMLVILATALLVNPGRALGIDGFLYERLRLPTWLI